MHPTPARLHIHRCVNQVCYEGGAPKGEHHAQKQTTKEPEASCMMHAYVCRATPPPRVHRSPHQYQSASKGKDAMQSRESKQPNTTTNMNHKHKRRQGMSKRSAQRKKIRGKGVRRVNHAVRNGSHSFTLFLLDDSRKPAGHANRITRAHVWYVKIKTWRREEQRRAT